METPVEALMSQEVSVAPAARPESAVRRTVGASILSASNLALKVGSNFVLIPITLKYLGREQYGVWILLQSVATYLALSELGIGQTVCNFQNVAFAQADDRRVNQVLTTTFWLYCLLAASAWVIFVFVLATQPVDSWLLKDATQQAAAHFKFYLGLAGTLALVRVPLTVFPVTLIGVRETVLRQIVDTALAVALLVSTLVALMFGGKLLALIVATNLAATLAMLLAYPLVRSRHPGIHMRSSSLSAKLFWPIFSNSIFFFLYGLGLLFQRIAGNLLAGKFVSLAEIPAFFVLLTLFRIVGWSLADIPSQTLQPYVIFLQVSREKDLISRLAALCTKVTFAAATVYAGLIWLFADVGIKFWLGPGMFHGRGPLALLAGSFLIDVLFLATNNFMRGLNRHHALSVVMVAYAGLSFVLAAIGARWWAPRDPLYGLCWGLFWSSVLTQALLMPWLTQRILQIRWTRYLKEFLSRPLLVAVCGLVFFAFVSRTATTNVWTLSAEGIAFVVLTALLFWRLLLSQSERSWLVEMLVDRRLANVWSLMQAP